MLSTIESSSNGINACCNKWLLEGVECRMLFLRGTFRWVLLQTYEWAGLIAYIVDEMETVLSTLLKSAPCTRGTIGLVISLEHIHLAPCVCANRVYQAGCARTVNISNDNL